MIDIVFAASLAVSGLTANSGAAKPTPLGNPREWIGADDYPRSAILSGAQGKTRFVLQVDARGQVQDCAVTGSSGNDGLDAVACALLKERAHFSPARDAKGHEIASTYSNSVLWQIPQGDRIPLMPMAATLDFDVDTDGKASGCKATASLPSALEITQMCSAINGRAEFEPFKDVKGTLVPRHVNVRLVVQVSDPTHPN